MASLHIDKEYDDMLNALKESLEMDKKKIVQLSIRYIHKNKINPENVKAADPGSEMKALRKDIIGFIKTQEKDFLDPMKSRLDFLVEANSKNTSPVQTNKPPSEDYIKLAKGYNTLLENYSRILDHIKKNDPALISKLNSLTEEIQKMNLTIENKLRKNLL